LKLDFIIAGVQKGGTTALHAFLKKHPQICLSGQKELHYFNNEQVDWDNPNYAAYHKAFDPQPGQIIGEATPAYIYWRPSIKRIKTYNPEIKLIISLRDPVKRAFSQWRMTVTRGKEPFIFSHAIRKGRERIGKVAGSKYGCHIVYSYVERGFYVPQIERLLKHFPREQVLFYDHQQMIEDQPAVLDKVCDFIGASRFKEHPENEKIVTTKKKDVGSLWEEDEAYLSDLFAEDTRKTAELTGLDLSHWKSWRG